MADKYASGKQGAGSLMDGLKDRAPKRPDDSMKLPQSPSVNDEPTRTGNGAPVPVPGPREA